MGVTLQPINENRFASVIHRYMHTHTTEARSHFHTYIYTHVNTLTHTHAHTHTHTHTHALTHSLENIAPYDLICIFLELCSFFGGELCSFLFLYFLQLCFFCQQLSNELTNKGQWRSPNFNCKGRGNGLGGTLSFFDFWRGFTPLNCKL